LVFMFAFDPSTETNIADNTVKAARDSSTGERIIRATLYRSPPLSAVAEVVVVIFGGWSSFFWFFCLVVVFLCVFFVWGGHKLLRVRLPVFLSGICAQGDNLLIRGSTILYSGHVCLPC